MTWLHRLQSESAIRLTETGLPRRLLRHLIFAHDVGVGSRVLDVGCGNGELVRFLDQLGVVATGICASSAELSAAQAAAPGLELLMGDEIDTLHAQDRLFDMVILRQSAPHADNLLSAEAFQATAALIEILRPGGNLVFVLGRNQKRGTDAPALPHAASCCSQHLGVFPGSCHAADFSRISRQPEKWRWMLGPQLRATSMTFTYCRPSESSATPDWQAIGQAASQSKNGRCCECAEQCDPATGQQSAA